MVRRVRIAALALVVLVLAACGGDEAPARAPVRVGVGTTPEQRVLGAVTVAALNQSGLPAREEPAGGDTVALRRAAIRRDLDVFWDYTGAAWALGLGLQAPPSDPGESYQQVLRADRANGLQWLTPSEANATLALFVRAGDLPKPGRSRDLAWLGRMLSRADRALCADGDFVRRPGGLDALAAAYGINRAQLTVELAGEQDAIAGVQEGRCFAGLASATSGRARLAGLAPVPDSRHVFPAFVVAPVAQIPALQATPRAARVLHDVARRLDTETLARLNASVESGQSPAEIATEFLSRR